MSLSASNWQPSNIRQRAQNCFRVS